MCSRMRLWIFFVDCWKLDDDCGFLFNGVFDFDVVCVLLYDVVDLCEFQFCVFFNLFGCEEWFEEFVVDFGWYVFIVIGY